MRDTEGFEQFGNAAVDFLPIEVGLSLQHRGNVVLDAEFTKHGGFLRKITDSEPGAFMHG